MECETAQTNDAAPGHTRPSRFRSMQKSKRLGKSRGAVLLDGKLQSDWGKAWRHDWLTEAGMRLLGFQATRRSVLVCNARRRLTVCARRQGQRRESRVCRGVGRAGIRALHEEGQGKEGSEARRWGVARSGRQCRAGAQRLACSHGRAGQGNRLCAAAGLQHVGNISAQAMARGQ